MEEVISGLKKFLREDQILDKKIHQIIYSYDMWPKLQILKMKGFTAPYPPRFVLLPENEEEVSKCVKYLSQKNIPFVPYGGGSGVCGAVCTINNGVLIDLKRMNKIVEIDGLSNTISVEAGIITKHLEEKLNEKGYTLGHFPSSIACSTIGGNVATRSAGQMSSKYGKIEDIITGMRVVLSDGEFIELSKIPGEPLFPDFIQIFTGSEGTLGIITKVKLKIFPLPEYRIFRGYKFKKLREGLEGMRQIMQNGLRPSVLRLYDPLDCIVNEFPLKKEKDLIKSFSEKVKEWTGFSFKDFLKEMQGALLKRLLMNSQVVFNLIDIISPPCMLIVGFEGDKEGTSLQFSMANEILLHCGGEDTGEEAGVHWFKNRYNLSFKQTKMFGEGGFVDTIEVSSLWTKIEKIYDRVRSALMKKTLMMAHFSHAYRDGCSIYFTVAGYQRNKKKLEDDYNWVVRTALGIASKNGASISHHHGIGIMKRSFLEEEYKGGAKIFFSFKRTFDSKKLMNPEKLYLPFDEESETSLSKEKTEEFNEGNEYPLEMKDYQWTPPDPENFYDLLKYAQERRTPLYFQSRLKKQKGVEINFDSLDNIISIDNISGVIFVQAGIGVGQVENFLRERGWTLGYLPKVVQKMSIGEYLSSGGMGDYSPFYSSLKDNCIGLGAIFSDGKNFWTKPAPRRACGPAFEQIFIGGEGKYGLITCASFKIFPRPNVEETIAFEGDYDESAIKTLIKLLNTKIFPLRVLIVLRPPNIINQKKKFLRIVFYLGGRRESVSYETSLLRNNFKNKGFEEMPLRIRERKGLEVKEYETLQKFRNWKEILEIIKRVREDNSCSFPEVQLRGISAQGGNLMFLKKTEDVVFPEWVLKLHSENIKEKMKNFKKLLKKNLDPFNILNPDEE